MIAAIDQDCLISKANIAANAYYATHLCAEPVMEVGMLVRSLE